MKNQDTAVKVKSKFPLGIKIASILACVAVLSVGFASWLILRPVETKTQQGSFTVYTVEENNVTITVAPVVAGVSTPSEEQMAAAATMVFGKGEHTASSSDWLKAQSDVAEENLSVVFKVTFESDNLDLDEAVSKLNLDFAIGSGVLSSFKNAVSAGYVANPVITYSETAADATDFASVSYVASNGAATLSIDAPEAKTATVYFKVVFDWGTVTGGENPYKFFNGKSSSAIVNSETSATYDYSHLAGDLLEAVYGLNGGGYTLTVSTTAISD